MADRADYQKKASESFNKVADILQSPGALPFWHVGRTLNTCHDYLAHNAANVPADVERFHRQVLPECTKFYLHEAGAQDNQNWWWDDYGWWGLAHVATGDLANAKDCWLRMRNYGVDTVGPGLDYLGGCWNHKVDQDPPGCENSVTNSTFILLSLRLLNNTAFRSDPLRKIVLSAAQVWMRWFDHWIGRPGALRNPLQLVRERPVGDEKDLFPKGQPEYQVGWIWTGDQGLAMAWAAEAFVLAPADWDAIFPGTRDRSKVFLLADQIRKGMTSLLDAEGVLHEAPYWANSGGNYRIDYCSGRGVFMRGIASADAVFRHQPSWHPSDAVVLSTANAVIALVQQPAPTLYSWNYSAEQAVLDTWKEKVSGPLEGFPTLCSDELLSPVDIQELVFHGIALDALTAATAVPQ
jgi:hypothetical protein